MTFDIIILSLALALVVMLIYLAIGNWIMRLFIPVSSSYAFFVLGERCETINTNRIDKELYLWPIYALYYSFPSTRRKIVKAREELIATLEKGEESDD